jgi:TPR repeat protein
LDGDAYESIGFCDHEEEMRREAGEARGRTSIMGVTGLGHTGNGEGSDDDEDGDGDGDNDDVGDGAPDALRGAAGRGEPVAQCRLGIACRLGRGVAGQGQDDAEAAVWFGKAAVQGYALGQYYLGLCYARGTGVQRDADEATVWFARAGAQGHAGACREMAGALQGRVGVQAGAKEEALEWWRKAAELGDATAQAQLGVLAEEGGKPLLAMVWCVSLPTASHIKGTAS